MVAQGELRGGIGDELQEVDEDLVKLMRSLGAKPLTIWRKVIVPGATPWILSTMRLNIGFAMIGAVADGMLRDGRTAGLDLEAFSRVPVGRSGLR